MQQDTDLEYERYKDWDFSKATPAKHPAVLELRAQKQKHDKLMAFFDADVQDTIIQHDTPQDRMRVNAILRALYIT